MFYQLDKDGFYLGVKKYSNEGMDFFTQTPPLSNQSFFRPKVINDVWIEGATPEEILQNTPVPEIITRRQFKIALAVLGKNEQSILNGIDQLPEPNRTIARISYTEAGTFERNNPELITVATAFLQMDSQQIDQVFIIGSQY
jgi:hypothetical protein